MKRAWLALLALSCTSAPPEARTAKAESGALRSLAITLTSLALGPSEEVDSPELRAYVRNVGQRVARGCPRQDVTFQFAVVTSSEPGAYAVIGNTVVITQELLIHLESEAELAGVLAHELAHLCQRHSECALKTPEFVRTPPSPEAHELSRDEERQSDSLAVTYLKRAGYDPHAFLGVVDALQRLGVEADDEHPDIAARRARAAAVAAGGTGEVGRDRFLLALEDLPVERPIVIETPQRAQVAGRWVRVPAGYRWEQDGFLARAVGPDEATLTVMYAGSPRSPWSNALRAALRKVPYTAHHVARKDALTATLSSSRTTWIDTGQQAWLVASSGPVPANIPQTMLARLAEPRTTGAERLTVLAVREPARASQLSAACGQPQRFYALNRLDPASLVPGGRRLKCPRGSSSRPSDGGGGPNRPLLTPPQNPR